MISEGTKSNIPPKSCTWRGQRTVSYKEKSLYRFHMISTWIARWSLEIKGSSSKLRLTRSMNSVVKWEIIASFSYDLYLDHRMALGDRGWYLKWPRDELNQLVRNISCLKIDEGVKDFICQTWLQFHCTWNCIRKHSALSGTHNQPLNPQLFFFFHQHT